MPCHLVPHHSSLELQFQRKLNLARRINARRTRDLAEVRIAESRIRLPEDRMIRQVEGFGAELQVPRFGQLEGLEQRRIDDALAWAGTDVARRIAQREIRGQGKGSRVEELAAYTDGRIRHTNVAAHQIWTLRAAADDATDGLLIGDGEGQAGLPCQTAVDLPAAEGLSGDALEVFAERQLIVAAERETMPHVEIADRPIVFLHVVNRARERPDEVAVASRARTQARDVVVAVAEVIA
jgi:hypothetical protein